MVAFLLRLSDSLRLSDNCSLFVALVRFFPVIGQLLQYSIDACPILRGYRTTPATFDRRLSDSSRLSDNSRNIRSTLVRFFAADHYDCGQHTKNRPILFRNGHFCLFIDVRADDPDKDRHQQDDREQPDEVDGGDDDRVRLKSRRQDGHIRQSTR